MKARAPLPKIAIELLREPMPRCFDSRAQWEAWRTAAIAWEALPELTASLYCADCTPKRKEQMVAAGRCVYPLVFFPKDEKGNVLGGVRPRAPNTRGWPRGKSRKKGMK